ncbi:MAG: NAD(+) synthase [Flavobacteriaceae bacterium]|nr:NAD(+) synthase [Flavobacteriaceae bacterium]
MQTKQVISYIVNWLHDYLIKSGQKGFVIGISGGIDSAVTSALAAKTGKPLWVIEMPIHQQVSQVDNAKAHISWLKDSFDNIHDMQVDLTPTFDAFSSAVNADKSNPAWEISLANSRSRLRMTTLYYYAGMHNLLVLGTGNKIEDFGIGFFTKYGDGGVDISPIADLLKSEVYLLAKELSIIESIQNAKPTDGLFGDNRSDEDQIGANYDELEWAMSVYQEKKPEDFEGRKKEILEIFIRMNRAMQHKINPIPVAVIPEELRN